MDLYPIWSYSELLKVRAATLELEEGRHSSAHNWGREMVGATSNFSSHKTNNQSSFSPF
jgi:hypothetical protein